MAEYIERKALDKALTAAAAHDKDKNRRTWAKAICILHDLPAADVAPVVRCRECKNSYEDLAGRVCVYGPCVDCIVPDNFSCAYGARMDGDSDA